MADNLLNNPVLRAQMHIFAFMRDKPLDFYALTEAWKATATPFELARQRLTPLKNATPAILSTNDFVTVSPSDICNQFYTFQDEDGEDVSFGENDVKMEYEIRHPNTTQDSDVEDGVDANEKYPHYHINEQTSPITTTSSQLLFSIAMDGPNEEKPFVMKAAYSHQLSVRIDEARKYLNLDCYEFKPTCADVTDEANPPIPTNRSVDAFYKTFYTNTMTSSGWESDDDEEEEDAEWLDKVLEPKEGRTFSRDDVFQLNYQALVGQFTNSRSLRIRLPLLDVTGVRLMRHIDSEDNEEDVGAVLILEFNKHGGRSYASRMVHSKYHCENEFATISDWTPGEVASRSTRFYFYGNLVELKQTAALIAKICPGIATMLALGPEQSNTLKTAVCVEYGTAPIFASEEDLKESEDDDKKMPVSKKMRTMTEEDVHKALIDAKIVDSVSVAKRCVNPCLKRAILLGHCDITPKTTPDSVIFRGECINCSKILPCTLRNAVDQTTYGGHDSGKGAAIICNDCETGNHITRICQGDMSYDCGKYHNHCTECPGFGVCIGDYREAHCFHCNQHYFRGNFGFPCPNCGGGKSKNLSQMPSPPPSAWDGEITNIETVWNAMLAREQSPTKRAMMKVMMQGPNANYDGNEVAGIISAVSGAFGEGQSSGSGSVDLADLMMAHMAADQNGTQNGGQNGRGEMPGENQCCLM